jgi:hypothetical protein
MKTLLLLTFLAVSGAARAVAVDALSGQNPPGQTAAAPANSEVKVTQSPWDVSVIPEKTVFGPRHRLILNVKPPTGTKPASALELRFGDGTLAVFKYKTPTIPSGIVSFDYVVDDTTRDAWGRAYLGTQPIHATLYMTEAGTGNIWVVNDDVEFDIPTSALQTWVMALLVGSFAVAILLLGWKSDLLRDPGADPAPDPTRRGPARRPFSLARCQMALWTIAVIWAFLLVWQRVGEPPKLSNAVLGLIGIASGTGLGAAVIQISKRGQDVQSLIDQQAKLAQLAATPGVLPQQLGDARNEIVRLQNRLAPQRSEGLLMDILSDADGISFHRFQLAAWTLVLLVIFIFETIRSLTIHDFDPTVLALMGISAGTYIGFKIPE